MEVSALIDKRLKTGGLSLPRGFRGNVGDIFDKIGMNSDVISLNVSFDSIAPQTTTSTSYVDVTGALSLFALEREAKVGFFLQASGYNENAFVDGSTISFRLYDQTNDDFYAFGDTFGDIATAFDGATEVSFITSATIFDLDFFHKQPGEYLLTPQFKVSGTGTAVCNYVISGVFTIGN